jgi:trehalose 6-phosphate phosphatase
MMKELFSTRVLERLGGADALLAFDFDGTLAPIVDDPASAQMRPPTRHLLAEVARLYPCAVISGRPEEDVLLRLGGVTVWYVIGARALRPPAELERLSRQVGEWRAELAELTQSLSGVTLEDKGVSLAVHYRHAADREQVCAVIRDAASLLQGARAVAGKEVVNILPDGESGKRSAVHRLRAQLGCAATLYVGDDRTDEDVFTLKGVTGVRVGSDDESAAQYYVRDQADVDELLERLVALREQRSIRPEAMRRRMARR